MVALHIVNAAFIDGTFLNLAGDWNLPAFASVAVFAIAGLTCWNSADRADQGDRRVWKLLAISMIVCAAESLVNVHGRVEEIDGLERPVLILESLLGLLAIIFFARRVTRMPKPVPILLALAAIMLAISQASGAIDSTGDGGGSFHALLLIVEEAGEMFVAALVVCAAISARSGPAEPATIQGSGGET